MIASRRRKFCSETCAGAFHPAIKKFGDTIAGQHWRCCIQKKHIEAR
jgi:hypothetical protein